MRINFIVDCLNLLKICSILFLMPNLHSGESTIFIISTSKARWSAIGSFPCTYLDSAFRTKKTGLSILWNNYFFSEKSLDAGSQDTDMFKFLLSYMAWSELNLLKTFFFFFFFTKKAMNWSGFILLLLLQRPTEGLSRGNQDLRSFKLILEYIKALPVSWTPLSLSGLDEKKL